jgi:hypothetical protein
MIWLISNKATAFPVVGLRLVDSLYLATQQNYSLLLKVDWKASPQCESAMV